MQGDTIKQVAQYLPNNSNWNGVPIFWQLPFKDVLNIAIKKRIS
jgi:hypothetical protein